jgi:hypothetical protein
MISKSMLNLAVVVLLVLAVGCDRRLSTGPSSGGVSVSGRVLNFATNTGVSGATVAFGDVTTVTDAGGSYTLALAAIGLYEPLVDGASISSRVRVTGSTYRGDFLVRAGTCVSRYGTIADAGTLRPIVGATVRFNGPGLSDSAVSGSDGWYRIDLGCPANGLVGFNTTFIVVSHPNYMDQSQGVGRGVFGVRRLDLELQRR